jgi:hypothetical protein
VQVSTTTNSTPHHGRDGTCESQNWLHGRPERLLRLCQY